MNAVLKFKKDWYEYMDLLSNTYYGGAKPLSTKVVLYGYVPSNIEDVCEDMDKAIVIGKTDKKIDANYLTSQSLNSVFDMLQDDEEEDDEEDDVTV